MGLRAQGLVCVLLLLLATAEGAAGRTRTRLVKRWRHSPAKHKPGPTAKAAAATSAVPTHPDDVAALAALNEEVKAASGGIGIPGWFPDREEGPCGDPENDVLPFPGVACPWAEPGQTEPVRVLSLILYERGLKATNVASITRLSALTAISLLGNRFSGPIPPGLASMQSLANIDFRNNNFSGPIPDLNGAPLATLLLANQKGQGGPGLSGPIPESIGSLGTLSMLDLSDNSLTGPIPASILGLPRLNTLILRSNLLSGRVPSLAPLANTIQSLDISRNPFDAGPMPPELNNLTMVTGVLDLSYMNLEGPLISLRHLGSVTDVILDGNRLSGPLNPRLLPQGSLGYISVKNNLFSGSISSKFLQLLDNNLYCMTTCGINFSGNRFTGVLPASLGFILQAFVFDFSNNRFRGSIPNMYGYIYSMLQLKFQNNKLTGPPPDFNPPLDKTYQRSLAELDLSGNLLSGSFPEQLTQFTRLRQIDMSNNRLFGSIPNITAIFQLTYLNISSNRFIGAPPAVRPGSVLDFSSNYFGGGYRSVASQYNPDTQRVLLSNNCFFCEGASSFCNAPQRSNRVCSKFCRARTVQPHCGGVGACNFWGGRRTATCKCPNTTQLFTSTCPSAGSVVANSP